MEVLVDFAYREEDLSALPIVELAQFVMKEQNLPDCSEVSIAFVNNNEMAELNQKYRGKQGPTDVLSFECDNLDDNFALVQQEINESVKTSNNDIYELGDIIIAPDVAEQQSKTYGTTFEGEISLLLVHGLLHVCGYDHQDDREARVMEQRESELLSAWADMGHEAVRHVCKEQ